ncbi:zinc finger protein 185 isoform X2 [Lampris incognitus]|uniref:zinc finger protein 185 isoform X2 n=1 Tax=Lampris incognitus TaxID=2546036 RepID=UPI0024B50340|nr:zinc finger protein 185 isoform X2 [Lampris incognitus]
MTDDLLALSDCEEELPEPMPPGPGRWSQDLLSGPDSVSVPTKTSDILDLLSDDVIPINTGSNSLSTQHEEEKQTDETAEDTRSTEDSIDSWSSHVTTSTVAESSSADPFDPYPIGTTSPNSSSDLLQPLPTPSINSSTELLSKTHLAEEEPSPDTSLSHDALEALAEDVIPIKTDATSLSTNRRAWTHTWDTGKPEYTTAEERSAGSDSPWDRWTSPTVYTTATTTEEEGESYDGVVPKTSDREDDQRAEMPELESKKGFVCVKEYVNASELSLHNASDDSRGGSDYSTSSASSYTCSSPSTYSRGSMSSTCTYCGEPVGNEGKITIEHLNINCHPSCFKCGVCGKPMGDLLCSMFLHGGTVHCESCYSKTFD